MQYKKKLLTLLAATALTSSSIRNILALNATEFNTLSTANLNSLTMNDIITIPVSEIPFLSIDKLSYLPPEQTGFFSAQQISAFNKAEIEALRNDQVAVILPLISTTQFGYLNQEQIQALSSDEINNILANLNPTQFGYLNQAQIQALSSDKINNILASLNPTQFGYLNQAQIQGLSSDKINNILASLNPTQFGYLNQEQIQGLSSDKINNILANLNPAQFGYLNQEQIQGLSSDKISAVLENLNPTQFGYLSAEQIADFTQDNIQALSNNKLSDILKALSDTQLDFIFQNINQTQIGYFTRQQLGAIIDAAKSLSNNKLATILQVLNDTQLNLILSTLTPAQREFFRVTQIKALNQEQIQALRNDQLADKLQDFTPAQMRYLSEEQIGSFTLATIHKLTTPQIQALSLAQVTKLRDTILTPLEKSKEIKEFVTNLDKKNVNPFVINKLVFSNNVASNIESAIQDPQQIGSKVEVINDAVSNNLVVVNTRIESNSAISSGENDKSNGGIWFELNVASSKLKNDANPFADYNSNGLGVVLGADYKIKNFTLGVFGGLNSYTITDGNNSKSQDDLRCILGGAYLNFKVNQNLSFSAIGGINDTSLSGKKSNGITTKLDKDLTGYFADIRAKYTAQLSSKLALIPAIGLKIYNNESFSYISGDVASKFDARTNKFFVIGTNVALSPFTKNYYTISPEMHIFGELSLDKNENIVNVSFLGNDIISTPIDKNYNLLNVGASVSFQGEENVVSLGIDWNTRKNYTGLAGKLNIRMNF